MKVKPNVLNTGLLRSCISIQSLVFDPSTSKWIVRRALCGKNVTSEQLERILKALKITPEDAVRWEVVK